MRRCLVGFLWLLGLWLGTLVAGGAVAGMLAASQARTCQPTPAADFAHGFEVGQRAGNAFRERHGAVILLGALIVAIGGTSLGALPGTRPRSSPPTTLA